ncbi:hypothetical protein LMG31506_02961 [Cupriavidus yeoncheonensis]|uniref:DUF3987 domain-containing protein n=1 Tax=Cupriavidus yeoncheonensis TaxID=1462994 RepID=A0A916IUH4_9BURK|nr:DUF3987 domain-containing protein [Cupriavidus yeoncheonensis]CAG2144230.1 hypothetical protein LMG31506_02961 [Cupriavidus yeoncheonensis]
MSIIDAKACTQLDGVAVTQLAPAKAVMVVGDVSMTSAANKAPADTPDAPAVASMTIPDMGSFTVLATTQINTKVHQPCAKWQYTPQGDGHDRARSALAWLDPQDWKSLAMPAKAAKLPQADFLAWSATGGVSEKEALSTWSKPSGGTGTYALYVRASDNGWPDPGKETPEQQAEAKKAARAAKKLLAAQQSAASAIPCPAPFPGPMEKLVELSLRYQNRQQPELTTAASLAAMSACLHGRWALTDRLRGNLYVIGLADSGSGKDAPLDLVKMLVRIAGGHAISNVGSGQGLEESLRHNPERRVSLVVDEVAHMIGAISNPNAADYQTGAEKRLLELFSASRSYVTTRVLADTTKPSEILLHPFVTLFGTTTREKMCGISSSVIDTGLLGRCLIVQGRDFPTLELYPQQGNLYGELEEALGAIAKSVYDFGPTMLKMEDGVNAVELSPEARDLELKAKVEHDDLARKADKVRRVLLSRAVEMAKRIALVLAAWDQVQVVTATHLDWALRFVRYSHICLLAFVDTMTDSAVIKNARKIEALMRDAVEGRKPFGDLRYKQFNHIAEDEERVFHSALLHKSKLDADRFKRSIAHLESAGVILIEERERTGPGRGSEIFYRLVD